MKSITEDPTLNFPERMALLNITPQLEAIVQKSGVKEGLLPCNAMPIIASIFVYDDEPGLHEDDKASIDGLARFDPKKQE